MEIKTYTDEELVSLFNNGDESAYEEIYRRYSTILYLFSRRLLNEQTEARDVVQDVFMNLWALSGKFQIEHSLSAFLYAAVRNRILKIFRRNKTYQKYIDSLDLFISSGVSVTDHLVRERQLSELIEREIALLPEKMREAFELSRKHNLSHKQIAERMNIAENTVKKQISNALRILKGKFGVWIYFYPFF
ncbi:RNA polymerase sigma-70 factor [Pedobacter frigidisoli]|uniref:RNA polymerase sigma factor n=1 Tax=Pedobacter frigidisoli TaxID=2530455 RepID=UPI00292D40A0|nr:RNA polymerase sigma-70 factor [Pedobacter frigidisoli]